MFEHQNPRVNAAILLDLGQRQYRNPNSNGTAAIDFTPVNHVC